MQNIPFIKTHSYYGLLESLVSPEELAALAVKNGFQTLALTDHHYLTGAIAFYEACIDVGITPIIGLEIDMQYQGYFGQITLLAKDIVGWGSLSHLSSLMMVENKQVNLEILHELNDNLICILGNPLGLIWELIQNSPTSLSLPDEFVNDIKYIFDEDLFIEIQRFSDGPLKNENLVLALANRNKLPIIATQNVFYSIPSDQSSYLTLSAIRKNTTVKNISREKAYKRPAYFPSIDNFIHRFDDIPDAINNLKIINERCKLDLPIGQTHYPQINTPHGESQLDYLRKQAYQGAKQIYPVVNNKITERLDYELNVISSMGYEPIFLVVQDVINQAQKLGIPTSSRGSAASSLVAHCLGITSPDPISLNLYFERFLNPARKKPPDIDTDIASHRRDEIIQYVFETYGYDRVAMVGTINRYRPKSAISDVAKAYGLSTDSIKQLSKRLPSSFSFHRNENETDPFSIIRRDNNIPVMQKILNDAYRILNLPRHLSVHPGGIIIAPFPIKDLIPLIHSSTLGINHTQFDLDGIEKLGMVKIDLLGIRGLTVLGEVAEKVYSWRRSEFKTLLQVLDEIPERDPETEKMITEAQTIGCFQIESPGMRATLQEIKAKTVDDIMAALALYRPGPLRGGLRDSFVHRFRGEEDIEHIHPSLEHLLGDTYGVILYQEQVLRIAHELGGLSIAQADILRRAMSHFDPGGVMDTLRNKFIEGAGKNKSVPSEIAERIWEMMAAFAGYGFPKAHAASYARLAWNAAWCKTHFPAEFMAAVLGYGGGYYSQHVYLLEARRLGLSIFPPHINHANHRIRVTYPDGKPKLYMGLNQVRDLTQKTIEKIITCQPYTSLEDFIIRVDPQQRELKNLILCGAFEGMVNIPEALKRLKFSQPAGQLSLFKNENTQEDWTIEKKGKAQQEILGVNLETSYLEKFYEEIRSSGAITIAKARIRIDERVQVAGMRQTFRRFKTKSKQMMAYLNLEDIEDSIQIMVPPTLYRQYFQILQEIGPFIVQGIVKEDTERQTVKIIAEKIILLEKS